MKASELLEKSKKPTEAIKKKPINDKEARERAKKELKEAELNEKKGTKPAPKIDKNDYWQKKRDRGDEISKEEAAELVRKGELEPGKYFKRRQALTKVALLCEIDHKETQKVYDKESEFYGTVNYKLILKNIENLEPNKRPDWVYAFRETLLLFGVQTQQERDKREKILEDIEKDLYLSKKYTLYTIKNKKGFKLYDWLEHPRN